MVNFGARFGERGWNARPAPVVLAPQRLRRELPWITLGTPGVAGRGMVGKDSI